MFLDFELSRTAAMIVTVGVHSPKKHVWNSSPVDDVISSDSVIGLLGVSRFCWLFSNMSNKHRIVYSQGDSARHLSIKLNYITRCLRGLLDFALVSCT